MATNKGEIMRKDMGVAQHQPGRSWPMRLLVGCAVLACGWPVAALAVSSKWAVAAIQRDGVTVSDAQIEIKQAGDDWWLKTKVRPAAALPAGVTLRTPAGTVIELVSPNGERLVSGPGAAALVLRGSSPDGESYDVLAGRWAFNVLKHLSFFNVTTRTVSAQTRGTRFSAEVNEATQDVAYAVQEGRIQIRHPVVALLDGEGAGGAPVRVATQSTEMLSAGEPERRFKTTPDAYLLKLGSYAQAQQYFKDALAAAEQAGDEDARFNMLVALGDTQKILGMGPQARQSYLDAYAMAQRQADLYWQATLLGRLGNAGQTMGDYQDAVAYFEKSMALHTRLPWREGEFTVQEEAANLVNAYLALGYYRCADRWGQRTLAQLKQAYRGHNHPAFAQLDGAIGDARYGLGQYAQALPWHQASLDILMRLRAPHRRVDGLIYHDEVAQAMNALGRDLSALGQPLAARTEHERVLKIAEALFGQAHVLQADAHHGLGLSLLGQGQAEAAIQAHEHALRILAAAPSDAFRLGYAHTVLAEAQLAAGKPVDALGSLARARQALIDKFADEVHPLFIALYEDRAKAYRAQGGQDAEVRQAQARSRALAAQLRDREAACLK